ncbi:MAG: tetratricopeptide repeat-containing sensor histidine kinase [Reichenbachiella sp.]|uniref:tetratricopeptide repeat-containing sensor histidine kinase n=1 Tax=Reichenbachiella sp. TaxID=2184521 RepID=UPI0032660F19
MIAKKTIIDPVEIQIQLETAFRERVNNIDYSISLASEALNKSKEINNAQLIAWSNAYLAYFNMIISDHTASETQANIAMDIFEKRDDRKGLALTYFTLGSIQYKTDNYHLALKHLSDSYQMYQAAGDKLGQSRALKAIGSVYEFFEEYDKAEETYGKCIELSSEIDDLNGVSNALNPLSGILIRKGLVDEALKIIKRSIRLKKSTNDQRGLGFAYYGLGKVYLAQKKYDLAGQYLSMSYDIHSAMNEIVGSMMTLNKQGQMHFSTGNFDLAKRLLTDCILKGEKSKHFLITHKSYKILYEIHKKEEDHQKALEYLELHLAHKEKVINKETKNVINSIQSMSRLELLEKETRWQKEVNNKIERKNKELDSFVYKVSHDLRGPISSLMGLFDLVSYEVKDPKALGYFEIYNKQIVRLNGILMDFLNLIQIKEKEIQIEEIDFEALIEDCLNSFEYHQNFHKINFEVRIKETAAFRSDKSTIISILQNLLENSIKYANLDGAPFVKIHIHEVEESISIKVTDNGLGIQKEDQKKIFDMFYRSHTDINGTGLGLYIVKSAVEKLSGKITVKSKVNQGSTLQVLLPFVSS